MNIVPMKIKDGYPRNSIGQLVSIIHSQPNFLKWCERELQKIPGGLDGLTKTEKGYTNQPIIDERKVA